MVNNSQADWIHLDIMDGLFVPNISFGFPVIEYVRKTAEKPLDVHLMIVDPDRYLTRFRDAGAAVLTVQYEACTHLNRTVSVIREHGMKAGVALNPHTPVSLLQNILPYIDMVLIMTVNPGFGGQAFIPAVLPKIERIRAMIDESGCEIDLEVDGGIKVGTARQVVRAGADVLVAGNAVFAAGDYAGAIQKLRADAGGNA